MGQSGDYLEETFLSLPCPWISFYHDSIIISDVRSKEHKFVTLKVYNEVAIELCMACLKFIKKTQKPTEEILFRYFQDIFPPKPLPYLRCVKSLLKFSLILKGDLLTCIAMVQCDLDTTVGLFCPHSQSLIST